MKKPSHHILVCGSFRMNGTPQGVCAKSGALNLLQYLQETLAERGRDDVAVSAVSCLKVCDRGPAVVIYPENWWFGHINSEEAIDALLDSLEKGEPAKEYLLE
ncbi:MAG: (2Fe-2S) ferredoxin domain-containing protein [Planctomycetaceae bacterium]|jgi:(2Fe-2S) ferredoxin|nr:(2Fe-2S) ferredoxin domain-containing protein [Planctomycetaceae bacterium]